MSNNSGGAVGAVALLMLLGYVLLWAVFAVSFAAYAVFSFWAIIMTLISLVAWNRPIRFFHYGITPYQARGIISFGIVGAILVPAFALYCEWLFTFTLPSDVWFHLVFGGYTCGALNFADEHEFASHEVDQFHQRELEWEARFERLIEHKAQEMAALPAPQKKFEYAEWEDAKSSDKL